MGRRFLPFGPEDTRRLLAYSWPGNVRELQNVVERGIILATGDRIALAGAMPEPGSIPASASPPDREEDRDAEPDRILRAEEMQEFERANLLRALTATDWKVAGAGGAAQRLGLPASTLASRMKALKIRRPGGS